MAVEKAIGSSSLAEVVDRILDKEVASHAVNAKFNAVSYLTALVLTEPLFLLVVRAVSLCGTTRSIPSQRHITSLS